MSLSKGDEIGVTVAKEWSEAVVTGTPFKYMPDDERSASRLFVARFISRDDVGLWVDPSLDTPPPEDTDHVLVPWRFVLAIQTSRVLQAKRREIGF